MSPARAEQPAFSRPDTASLFGKRTKPVRSLVAEPTKDGLTKLWRGLKFASESEFIATLIEIRVHGVEHVAKVHGERVKAVAGIGSQSGHE